MIIDTLCARCGAELSCSFISIPNKEVTHGNSCFDSYFGG